MTIIDAFAQPDHAELLSLCMEDWSKDAHEAGPGRRRWLNSQRELGLRAKFALDESGMVGGMIQYGPIEHSFVNGENLFFIYCIFVHGYKQGRGNFQKRGMGRALLQSAEEDARKLGAAGMAAWGIRLPFWMKASWFRRQGYMRADGKGLAVLMWKGFHEGARAPGWFQRQKGLPEPIPGKVNVTAFHSGWCMAQNLTYERAKRASREFGAAVAFREIDTSSRDAAREWGVTDAVFVDGKNLQKGPPPGYAKIYRHIARRVRRL